MLFNSSENKYLIIMVNSNINNNENKKERIKFSLIINKQKHHHFPISHVAYEKNMQATSGERSLKMNLPNHLKQKRGKQYSLDCNYVNDVIG